MKDPRAEWYEREMKLLAEDLAADRRDQRFPWWVLVACAGVAAVTCLAVTVLVRALA